MTRRLPLRGAFAAFVCALLAAGGPRPLAAQDGGKPRGGGGGSRGGPEGVFRTETPDRAADVVAGRPTKSSAVLSIRTARDVEGCVEVAAAAGKSPVRTPVRAFAGGTPSEVRIDGLEADRAYSARFLWRAAGAADWTAEEPVSLRTQRPPGATFTFTVQSDSHLDTQTQPALYERTVRNAAACSPDFHVDLGDTFMVDKRRDDFRQSAPQYPAQRWYLSLVRAPVFLVLGNHDGECGWRDTGSPDDMPAWSLARRKLHFPNPEPDGFYTGPAPPRGGATQNWYAFEWGDALFVALDPFRPTRDRKGRDADGWSWTLGAEQYAWLEKTLAASRAKFRFVMTHHLVGGLGTEARGGSEAAELYEWGGKSADGSPAFAAKRPGWTAPIQELLRRAGPTVVLHGHDHFWARQELDGVVYQMVPQPGHPGGDASRLAAEYGYRDGEFRSSPGFVRVTVSPTEAKVELVRTVLGAGASRTGEKNGDVAASYVVRAAAPK